ncbi:MAG: hypothetical protein JO189_05620, partial [Deltaproteobacteria bacterium]|nr:hypothetical protein [Deltaproteobacteria bacterium]
MARIRRIEYIIGRNETNIVLVIVARHHSPPVTMLSEWSFPVVKASLFIAGLLTPYLAYAANAGTNSPVNKVAARSVGNGNCPATPPPAAQRAGFTTLAYCLDGANPANAALSNWVNCAGKAQANSKIWSRSGGYCDRQHILQDIDPSTGKTVLHFRQLASDTITCVAGGCRDIDLNTGAAPLGQYS